MDELNVLRQFVQSQLDAADVEATGAIEDYAAFYSAQDTRREVLYRIDEMLAARTPTGS